MRVAKPHYSTSKLHLWLAQALAWLVVLAVTLGAILGSDGALALAPIAFPSMVGLIAVMLGLHRGFGSLDMWTAAKHGPRPFADPQPDPAPEPA
jgi:hypothetical protein